MSTDDTRREGSQLTAELGLEPERTAFEHWVTDEGKYPRAAERMPDGGYVLASTHASWCAWRACWPYARAAIYSAEQTQIEAPLRARLAKAEHWAKHAMLMRSAQNEELLRILRGEKP